MKRIKTFGLFEAEQTKEEAQQRLEDYLQLSDALNESAKELGCHFSSDPQFGISSYNVPLRRGFFMDNRVERQALNSFRSLILSVFFGIQETDQPGWVLTFYDTGVQGTNTMVFDWASVNYSSGRFAYEDGMSFHNGHCIQLSQSAGLTANVTTVMNCLQKMIAKIGYIKCDSDGTFSNAIDLHFKEMVPVLVPAFASYALGEPDGIKRIADAIREAGDARHDLIVAIKKSAPALWEELMPALGSGATETGNLADLGF